MNGIKKVNESEYDTCSTNGGEHKKKVKRETLEQSFLRLKLERALKAKIINYGLDFKYH